jgi:hypothetical protein
MIPEAEFEPASAGSSSGWLEDAGPPVGTGFGADAKGRLDHLVYLVYLMEMERHATGAAFPYRK